ncbi:MAG: hypothetical protein IK144_12355 [Bacteroidaceae bacterium]|nr:hypothetical protein [Bacteroidaceae bacterium]
MGKISGDKYVHVLTCQVIAFCLSRALYPFMGKPGVLVALPVTIAIGFYKEIDDDKFDYEDFVADIIGALWGSVYSLI